MCMTFTMLKKTLREALELLYKCKQQKDIKITM